MTASHWSTVVTCREFADFVMDYLDDGLAAEERQRFEAHLAECPDCVRYLQEYRDTLAVVRGPAPTADIDAEVAGDVPEDLVRAVLAARKPPAR